MDGNELKGYLCLKCLGHVNNTPARHSNTAKCKNAKVLRQNDIDRFVSIYKCACKKRFETLPAFIEHRTECKSSVSYEGVISFKCVEKEKIKTLPKRSGQEAGADNVLEEFRSCTTKC